MKKSAIGVLVQVMSILSMSRAQPTQNAGSCSVAGMQCNPETWREIAEDALNQVRACTSKVDEILTRLPKGHITPKNARLATSVPLGYNYLLHLKAVTWEQARTECLEMGYLLARIESSEEDAFIRNLTKSISHASTSVGVWIDGTDEGHEGCWVWTSAQVMKFADGFTHWASRQGEPNNNNGQEHCLMLYAPKFAWNDMRCWEKNAYMCKQAIGSVAITQPTRREYIQTPLC